MLPGIRLRRPTSVPAGFLGMLFLLFLIESLIESRREWYMTPHELDWRVSGQRASSQSVGADILIFGDSMLKFGLSPIILEHRLNKSVRSLAILDGKPAASYFLLRRALEGGARPDAILVDFQPECLYETSTSLSMNRHWKALLNVRETLDYAVNYGEPGFLQKTLLSRWLPSFGCRVEIRSYVMLALRGLTSPNPRDNAKVARNRIRNRGGLLLPPDPGYRGEVNPTFAGPLYASDWFQQPVTARYVRRFMALARDHGITVVWMLPPNVPEVESTRERIGQRARYDAFISSIVARYRNVCIYDCRQSGFDASLFVDPVHLNRDGAISMSVTTADALAGLFASDERRVDVDDRWVRLVARKVSEPAIALEDMAQSQERLFASSPSEGRRR